jgi:dipeptidyl-peptidase-4
MAGSFPRRYAATQRFTLGEPRNVTVSPDGERVVFLRSRGGDDPLNVLWVYRPRIDMERLTADPQLLLAGDGQLPPEELARRERLREGASGITSYATDDEVTTAAFALAGRLFVADLVAMRTREVPVTGPVFDPRPDPMGQRIAYVSSDVLRVVETDGTDWELAGDDDPNVSWGSAEFIAAEEMRRQRGFWWAPDGSAIVAARVDVAPVARWWVGDPAHPERSPVELRYPAAGTENAEVSLHVLSLDGAYVEIEWDLHALPYLVDVSWKRPDRILVTVQSRDQCTLEVLEADPRTGATTTRWSDTDDAWVEIVAGVPALLGDGRLVTAADRLGARRLMVEGLPVTMASLQVRSVVHVGDAHVVFLANPITDPTVCHVWRWSDAGGIEELTTEPGVHDAVARGSAIVVRSARLDEPGVRTSVLGGPTLLSLAEDPGIRANVLMRRVGPDRLAAAVLLPRDHDGGPLPVLVDSYGGPHAQRVVANHNAHVLSQWFADQGFAVVVIDGHGTPGRGSEWERAVLHDLAQPVLEDQVVGLHALADELGVLDLSRVAIRGWSFGGYLAALAVMERPDVFHAAIAGAPVTDWRLYDTHYTERYLGHPGLDPTPYDRCSLIARAGDLVRPLLLIHGLSDDNVVAAHTLQLSAALLAAGAPHEVLPLAGVTHMTPQEVVAEHLLLHQLDFLRRTVGARSSLASHEDAHPPQGYGSPDA